MWIVKYWAMDHVETREFQANNLMDLYYAVQSEGIIDSYIISCEKGG
ncbi:MAG: hypothetical protein V3R57_07785 [Candidatus Bathyarchaeia archaeon]